MQHDAFPKRLRRLPVMFTQRSRPLIFVTLCVAGRRRILDDPAIHHAFRAYCACSPEKAQAWIGRYVLMPDHVHAFVSLEGSHALSRWVSSLKKYLAVVLRASGGTAPFWQAGFFDHVMRTGESYGEKWAYVLQNPVRAGLVQKAEHWPYAGEIHELRWE